MGDITWEIEEQERKGKIYASMQDDVARYRQALALIASPMRPDGTFNRDRESCRQLAQEALFPKKP